MDTPTPPNLSILSEVSEQANIQKQAQADAVIRNQVEGKFGVGKRRFSLARVMAKLAPTAETTIAVTLLVMNLEQLLRQFLFVFFAVVLSVFATAQSLAVAPARSSMFPDGCLRLKKS